MGTKGTQGNPYGHIKTIKIKIGEIHSKMEVSGRFEAVWPIVCRAIIANSSSAAALRRKPLLTWQCCSSIVSLFLAAENEDPVKRHQSKQSCETCLTPMNLEAKVVSNTTSQTISKATGEGRNSFEIAPGENKIPTNRLRQIDGDVKAFPKHYPSGKYGINYPRKYKLTNQMFFNQRLLNADERFSNDNLYVFMASTFIEQEQLEKQINISGMRGSSKPGADGETVVNLQDLFSVFKSIKGTPKYWQTAKYELIAKVKQLGPFHLFFTFSCGEMM